MFDYISEIGIKEKNMLVQLSLETVNMQLKQDRIQKTAYGMFIAFMILMVIFHSFYVGLAGIICLAFGLFYVPELLSVLIKKDLEKDGSLESKEYHINQQGINDIKWSSFSRWGQKDSYIWVRQGEDKFLLFDKEKLSDGEAKVLKSYLRVVKKH